jgi:hypothetical protein
MNKRGADRSNEDAHGKRGFRYFSEGPIEDLGPVDAARAKRADEQPTTADNATDHLPPFPSSADMRAIAERSVEQARQAFDGFIGAAQRAVDMFGETAGKGAKDIAEKAMAFAQKDLAISFDFARQLVRAQGVQDVLKLQADYVNAQVQLISDHARTDAARAKK